MNIIKGTPGQIIECSNFLCTREERNEYLASLRRAYELLTSRNDHTAAALMLVIEFGTEEELEDIKSIQYLQIKHGYLHLEQQDARDLIAKKYYPKLKAI